MRCFLVSAKVQIELLSLGVVLEVERGIALQDTLASLGAEFPCGGSGTCGGCRIQVVEGQLKATAEDISVLSSDELASGWRLACRARAQSSLKVNVPPSTMPVLADDHFPISTGRKGLGIAIDLGTTTIAAQLWDLESGRLHGVRTGLNPQAIRGSDLISRLRFALTSNALTPLIRHFLGGMVHDLARCREEQVAEVILVGNVVMHHLFCGIDVKPLAHAPFQSPANGEHSFVPTELGWKLPASTRIRFLPSIGGFVGSDVFAGIVAVGLGKGMSLRALVDLGTNGEIAVGNERRILCASTAAGTAFEAGSITMGMRATSGAVSHVFLRDGTLECTVIGDGEPHGHLWQRPGGRGCCGSPDWRDPARWPFGQWHEGVFCGRQT